MLQGCKTAGLHGLQDYMMQGYASQPGGPLKGPADSYDFKLCLLDRISPLMISKHVVAKWTPRRGFVFLEQHVPGFLGCLDLYFGRLDLYFGSQSSPRNLQILPKLSQGPSQSSPGFPRADPLPPEVRGEVLGGSPQTNCSQVPRLRAESSLPEFIPGSRQSGVINCGSGPPFHARRGSG